jgi:hypothetical protein
MAEQPIVPLPSLDMRRHVSVSPCPYAPRSVTTLGLSVTDVLSLRCAATLLQQYSRAIDLHETTMFAVQFATEVVPGGLRTLASLFRYIVHHANSTEGGRNQLYANILEPSWRLTVEDAKLFAIALSPLYPITHHRYTESESLLLFQPESLFTRFGITSGPSRIALSQTVAERFSRAGRPYISAHPHGVPKSLRIILTVGDVGIEWWKLPFPNTR